MKRIFILVLLPLLAINFSSCEKVKDEINEVTTTEVSTDVVVPIEALQITSPKGEDFTFSINGKYNLEENKEIKQYLGRIQNIKIKSITLKIRHAEPADMTLKKCMFLIKGSDNNLSCSYNMPSEFPLTVGSELTLTQNDIDWNVIDKILKELKKVETVGNGIVNASSDPSQGEAPSFSFNLIFRTTLTISANL